MNGPKGIIALAVLALPFPALAALGDETAATRRVANSAENLQQWSADLGHDDFARREQASQRLAAAGSRAIPLLADALQSDNPEIAWRAGAALEQIGAQGDQAALASVAATLARIDTSGRPELAALVSDIRQRQTRLRRDQAVATIESLGGEIEISQVESIALPVDVAIFAAIDVVAVEGDISFAEEGEIVLGPGEPLLPAELAPPAPFADVVDVVDVEIAPAEVPPLDVLGMIDGVLKKVLAPAEELPAVAPPPDDLAAPPAPELPAAEVAPPPDEVPALLADDVGFVGPALMGGFAIAEPYGSELNGEYSVPSVTFTERWKGGDEALALLRELPELTQISIQGADLSDKALEHLARLPKLAHLQIRETNISASALLKLRAARPEIHVVATGDAMLGVSAAIGVSPCLIESVVGDSGAHTAGLRPGDRILKVGESPITGFSDLMICVYGRKAGETVAVEYERDGVQKVAQVELKSRRTLE